MSNQSLNLILLLLIIKITIINNSIKPENIKTLIEKSKKQEKFYRHSGIKVVYNENENRFQCIVDDDYIIYNLPSFIIPNNRLICEYSLKSHVYNIDKSIYSKVNKILEGYRLQDSNGIDNESNIDLDLKYTKFGKKYNNLYRSIYNHIEYSIYLSIIDKHLNESSNKEGLIEVKDLLSIISLYSNDYTLELPSILSLSTTEISYIQKILYKLNIPSSHIDSLYEVIHSINKLISELSLSINITKQKLVSIFSFIQSKAISFNANKLFLEENISKTGIENESVICLNDSILFCNFSGDYSRLYYDKYYVSNDISHEQDRLSDDNFRVVISSNNDVLFRSSEYLIFPYSYIDDGLKFDFIFENLLFKRIFYKDKVNKHECQMIFNSQKEVEGIDLSINYALLSICNLVGVSN